MFRCKNRRGAGAGGAGGLEACAGVREAAGSLLSVHPAKGRLSSLVSVFCVNSWLPYTAQGVSLNVSNDDTPLAASLVLAILQYMLDFGRCRIRYGSIDMVYSKPYPGGSTTTRKQYHASSDTPQEYLTPPQRRTAELENVASIWATYLFCETNGTSFPSHFNPLRTQYMIRYVV